MRIKVKIGILIILAFCNLLSAFMIEVPFCTDPYIPKITMKLCRDELGKRLFGRPEAMRVLRWRDKKGDFHSTYFVVDRDWNRILYARVDSDISKIDRIKAFGKFGRGDGQFDGPHGIDVDDNGRIFVADSKNKRVVQLKYNFNKNSISFSRNITTAGFHYIFGPLSITPFDVCNDDNGTPFNFDDDCLWICSPPNIFKLKIADLSLVGKYTEIDEAQPGAWFNHPVAIAKGQTNGANNNQVYVADYGHQRIVLLDDSGGHLKWIKSRKLEGTRFASISTDYYGNVYVADYQNSRIIKLDPELEKLQYFGSQGTSVNQFNHLKHFSVVRKSLQGFAIESWANSSGIRTYRLCYGIDSVKLSQDTITDTVKIRFFLNNRAQVTVRVIGAKTIIDHKLCDKGECFCDWDGRDSSGNLVLPNNYTVVVDAWSIDKLAWYDSKSVVGIGLPRADTSNIGLVLKISLQRDTIWLGEPLILTSTLINKSAKPIVIRAECANGLQELGLVGQILVEPSGKSRRYKIGFHVSSLWPLLKVQQKILPPGDSIYWRKLLWFENFDPSVNLEDFALGQYRIIGKYYHFFDDESMHIRQKIFSDSVSFVLAYQSNLVASIKPIRSELKNLFWYDGTMIGPIKKKNKVIVSREARAESFFQYLLKIRNLDTPFTIYADYLLPIIVSLTKMRKKDAVIMAEEFIKKYPFSPLSEEMAFCKGNLIERTLAKKPEQDSLMEIWLKPIFKQYPKNAFRFAFELGRSLNEIEKKEIIWDNVK